jgi:hypothetical protein
MPISESRRAGWLWPGPGIGLAWSTHAVSSATDAHHNNDFRITIMR